MIQVGFRRGIASGCLFHHPGKYLRVVVYGNDFTIVGTFSYVDWFKANNLYDGDKEYVHSVGHSYRSHVPIEPYLSDQWYVRVTDDRLCNEALRSLSVEQYNGTAPARESGKRDGDGELKFYPERFAHSFQAWHENLRDWCISW